MWIARFCIASSFFAEFALLSEHNAKRGHSIRELVVRQMYCIILKELIARECGSLKLFKKLKNGETEALNSRLWAYGDQCAYVTCTRTACAVWLRIPPRGQRGACIALCSISTYLIGINSQSVIQITQRQHVDLCAAVSNCR